MMLLVLALLAQLVPDGWVEHQAPKYDRFICVSAGGALVVRVHGYGRLREENVSHLAKIGTEGAASVSVEFAFTGDQGQPGQLPIFSDGTVNPDCSGHPTIADSEMFCITLYDDGKAFLGLCIGMPDSILAWWPRTDKTEPFAVIAVVQKDWEATRVQAISQVPAIPMYEHVMAKLSMRDRFRVDGEVSFGGETYRLATSLHTMVSRGGRVGQIATAGPRTACTGGPWREFTTYSPEVR